MKNVKDACNSELKNSKDKDESSDNWNQVVVSNKTYKCKRSQNKDVPQFIWGLFFFKVRSVTKLEPQWESDEALRRCVAQCL